MSYLTHVFLTGWLYNENRHHLVSCAETQSTQLTCRCGRAKTASPSISSWPTAEYRLRYLDPYPLTTPCPASSLRALAIPTSMTTTTKGTCPDIPRHAQADPHKMTDHSPIMTLYHALLVGFTFITTAHTIYLEYTGLYTIYHAIAISTAKAICQTICQAEPHVS